MAILTDEQIKEEKRKKQMAILKASNELLEQAKQTIMKTDKIGDFERSERIKEINKAQSENLMKGRTSLNATSEEIEASEYGTASASEVEKYKHRLEKRGITDEQMRQKESAVVEAAGSKGKNVKRGRRTSIRKKDVEGTTQIAMTEEEKIKMEELMNKSRIKDDKELKKRVLEGEKRMREHEPIKILTDAVKNTKLKETIVNDFTAPENQSTIKSSKPSKSETTKEKSGATTPKSATKTEQSHNDYDFDFSSIPSYVQYDIIPLPSNGECYPHKKSRLPVAYLTAADENIIASPNMYRDGKIMDVILKRKILDNTIDVSELVKGDRDAIALWLRATGYGVDFPVVVTNPDNGHKYDIVTKLDSFDYLPFNLKGDENGCFEYKMENGDVFKFKFLTQKDEDLLRENIVKQNTDVDVFNILKNANSIEGSINANNSLSEDTRADLLSCVDDIKEILKDTEVKDKSEDTLFNTTITEQMMLYTVSINGNEDKDYIRGYIENMRSKEAYAYRTYIMDNKPGVDFSMTVNIPQSDGGGSFDTFLRIDDTIFINI